MPRAATGLWLVAACGRKPLTIYFLSKILSFGPKKCQIFSGLVLVEGARPIWIFIQKSNFPVSFWLEIAWRRSSLGETFLVLLVQRFCFYISRGFSCQLNFCFLHFFPTHLFQQPHQLEN